MYNHIMQSKEWGTFKSAAGTKAVTAGNVQYTIHRIPKTKFSYAYCAKVNPFEIKWEPLIESVKENNCFVLNFDVPHVVAGTHEETKAAQIFEKQGAKKAPKNTFTKYNVLLDISQPEEALLASMHKKHRYNIRYAQKKGVTIRKGSSNDLEIFYDLHEQMGKRQKVLNHPESYFEKLWKALEPKNMAHLLIAEFENKPLAGWVFFTYDDVLYYPYGGSTEKHRNLQASSLLAWEGVKLGKSLGCNTFDMWGACKDPDDKNDPEWGFTNFKMRFGGKHVTYMDSYDYAVNPLAYSAFSFAYPKVLKLLRTLR